MYLVDVSLFGFGLCINEEILGEEESIGSLFLQNPSTVAAHLLRLKIREICEGSEMAPGGRKRKAGQNRADAARERMKAMGFEQRVITQSIKEILPLYNDNWLLIEEESYVPLFNLCLEKQEEISKQLATNQNQDIAEDQNQVIAEEEEKESEMQVEDGGDQADTVSIPSEAVMDPSPAAFPFGDASDSFALHSVPGTEHTNFGWLDDEDEDDKGGDNAAADDDDEDDDDEIIHLTPEPLCEELEELLREVRGQKKRKIGSRWDT